MCMYANENMTPGLFISKDPLLSNVNNIARDFGKKVAYWSKLSRFVWPLEGSYSLSVVILSLLSQNKRPWRCYQLGYAFHGLVLCKFLSKYRTRSLSSTPWLQSFHTETNGRKSWRNANLQRIQHIALGFRIDAADTDFGHSVDKDLSTNTSRVSPPRCLYVSGQLLHLPVCHALSDVRMRQPPVYSTLGARISECYAVQTCWEYFRRFDRFLQGL
jgi:hypothetical protein